MCSCKYLFLIDLVFILFVKDEQLDLNDKVAFAVRYLNDQRLFEKL
jgi:hypothetical protein